MITVPERTMPLKRIRINQCESRLLSLVCGFWIWFEVALEAEFVPDESNPEGSETSPPDCPGGFVGSLVAGITSVMVCPQTVQLFVLLPVSLEVGAFVTIHFP